MSEGTLRQILLITDGCSNEGNDPVAMAALAREYQVTVNVIGILDDGELGQQGIAEVEQIAQAGGGIHQVVYARDLSKTVQMVTRQAMTQTIQRVVNQELQHILGNEGGIEDLAPEKRGQVVEVVEQLGETMSLDVLILVDTSASMKSKLTAVKQALRDLKISLQSRQGDNRFSLWTYPDRRDVAALQMAWSNDVQHLEKIFRRLSVHGTTPTGPALEAALNYMTTSNSLERTDDIKYIDEEGMYRGHA